MLRTFPIIITTPSSAKPWAKTPCLLSQKRRLSATNGHSIGDKPPACGNPHCVALCIMFGPTLTHTVRCSVIEPIQLCIAGITWRSYNAFLIEVIDVLSKVPCMSKKMPSAYSPPSWAFSTHPTKWCNALSLDFPAWNACYCGCIGMSTKGPSHRYLSTSFSNPFNRKKVKLIGQNALAVV